MSTDLESGLRLCPTNLAISENAAQSTIGKCCLWLSWIILMDRSDSILSLLLPLNVGGNQDSTLTTSAYGSIELLSRHAKCDVRCAMYVTDESRTNCTD